MKEAPMEKKNRKRRRAIYSPFISAGVISVDDLQKLVDTMKAEGAQNVKLTGETIFVWDTPDAPEGLEEKTGFERNEFRFGGVRPVKMCSAETFCERFQRPVLDLALEIDRRFHGVRLDMKLMIGVAGCQRSCSEPSTKDIGVIAHPDGYEIMAGGAAGLAPRIGHRLTIAPTVDETLDIIEKILNYCRVFGKKNSRLGKIIEKHGMDHFVREVLGESGAKTAGPHRVIHGA